MTEGEARPFDVWPVADSFPCENCQMGKARLAVAVRGVTVKLCAVCGADLGLRIQRDIGK